MKREDLTFQTGFRVSVGNDRSQGAVMVLGKGGCEGGPDNRPGSWGQVRSASRSRAERNVISRVEFCLTGSAGYFCFTLNFEFLSLKRRDRAGCPDKHRFCFSGLTQGREGSMLDVACGGGAICAR
jgi:hypothetical protein